MRGAKRREIDVRTSPRCMYTSSVRPGDLSLPDHMRSKKSKTKQLSSFTTWLYPTVLPLLRRILPLFDENRYISHSDLFFPL